MGDGAGRVSDRDDWRQIIVNKSEIGMTALMSRVAGELSGLRDVAVAAEHAFGDLLLGSPIATERHSASIQELDRLSQTLASLAQLFVVLSERDSIEASVNSDVIAGSVKLMSLSSRLLDHESWPSEDAADVEFF